MAEDGKVVIKYEGDISGIDKASNDAEKRVKDSSKKIDETVKDSAKNTSGETSKMFSGGADKVAGVAKGIGAAAVGAFAVGGAAAVAFGKHGLELASDLNEVQNVVDTTFGKNNKAIEDFSKNAAAKFGLSELSAKQMTSTIGAMTKSMGLTAPEVQKMSTGLTGLSGDMASFYNLDPTEAFEKIKSGISGETEPLKSLGINMSDANLNAYALASGMGKTTKEMSESEKVTLRYNYLMKVTKDAQGDFAKTSGGFANQQRILKMEFDSIAASVGTVLLPLATQFIGIIRTMFTENGKTTAGLKDFFTQLTKIAAAALPQLLAAIGQIMPILMNIVSQVLPLIMNLISSVLPLLINLVQTILPPLMQFIQMLLPPLIQIVQTILPVIIEIFKELLPPLMEIVKALLPPLLAVIMAILPPILQLIKTLLPPLTQLLVAFAGYIKMLTPLITWLAGIIGNTLGGVLKNIAPIVANVINIFTNLLNFIQNVFAGRWGAAFGNIRNIISNAFSGLVGIVKLPINNMIALLNGFISGLNRIKIPSWVPNVGGRGISIPTIPRLANGGLAYQPQQVMVGDNPNASVDPEVIAPLSKLRALISAEFQRPGSAANSNITVIVQPAPVTLDGRTISQNTTQHQQISAALKGLR